MASNQVLKLMNNSSACTALFTHVATPLYDDLEFEKQRLAMSSQCHLVRGAVFLRGGRILSISGPYIGGLRSLSRNRQVAPATTGDRMSSTSSAPPGSIERSSSPTPEAVSNKRPPDTTMTTRRLKKRATVAQPNDNGPQGALVSRSESPLAPMLAAAAAAAVLLTVVYRHYFVAKAVSALEGTSHAMSQVMVENVCHRDCLSPCTHPQQQCTLLLKLGTAHQWPPNLHDS